MAQANSAAAFCPSSNLFLGSGLFDFDRTRTAGVAVGLGTDVGGGTSLNLLRTLGEAYKVLQLKGQLLTPAQALYLGTLGAATALGLEDKIGNFASRREADFVVLNADSTALIKHRLASPREALDWLFALFMLGDERAVTATYLMGETAANV